MMKEQYMVMHGGNFEAYGIVLSIVILADLILLGIWLWKKVVEKK